MRSSHRYPAVDDYLLWRRGRFYGSRRSDSRRFRRYIRFPVTGSESLRNRVTVVVVVIVQKAAVALTVCIVALVLMLTDVEIRLIYVFFLE